MRPFRHIPVLRNEVLAALKPAPSGTYVDGTVGGAGHAATMLEASSPTGRLVCCDRDGEAIRAARESLARFGSRVEIRQGNFAELGDWVESETCAGALLDLGVSSPQLDTAERGFSFMADGPLDMRMDSRSPLTAATIVNTSSAKDLEIIFRKYSGEPRARRLARAIDQGRRWRLIETTRQLAEIVEKAVPRKGARIHPATRVFQALRIAVNGEIENLERGLRVVWGLLKQGGRLAVITFHSLEVRTVKGFGDELARDYTIPGPVDVLELRQHRDPTLRWVTRKGAIPSDDELRSNPRARSAQLRVMEKI